MGMSALQVMCTWCCTFGCMCNSYVCVRSTKEEDQLTPVKQHLPRPRYYCKAIPIQALSSNNNDRVHQPTCQRRKHAGRGRYSYKHKYMCGVHIISATSCCWLHTNLPSIRGTWLSSDVLRCGGEELLC